MGKRLFEHSFNGQPRKKGSNTNVSPIVELQPGEILTDLTGKQWRLGKGVGLGGFGQIFLVSDNLTKDVSENAKYVCKIENHMSGPLFVEINCYLRIGKEHMINAWKTEHKLNNLGVPHYVASGSHQIKDNKYRFLILPKYDSDLEKIFISKNQKFNMKTVLTISLQIIDILEYIHSKGYVHSDIKASNIMLQNNVQEMMQVASSQTALCIRYHGMSPLRTCKIRSISRVLRNNNYLRCIDNDFMEKPSNNIVKTKQDQVFLLDYGLASKYLLSNGNHKTFCTDERKAHAGTILFCSVDAHLGVQSRKSDMECLGYNMIHWLTANLPWNNNLEDAEIIHKTKKECLDDLHSFLTHSFGKYPKFISDYFEDIINLNFEDTPNYNYYRKLFKKALKDFNNLESWGQKIKNNKLNNENCINFIKKKLKRLSSSKPILRKKLKHKRNWSSILIDPEEILKQAKTRDRKLTETSDTCSGNSIYNMDIYSLNPTYAMIEVYNKCKERGSNSTGSSPRNKGDCLRDNIDGYTPAMMAVYNRMKEKEEMEYEKMVVLNNNNLKIKGRNRKKVKKTKNTKPEVKFTPVKTRSAKSLSDAKKEASRKLKSSHSTRSYRLRG